MARTFTCSRISNDHEDKTRVWLLSRSASSHANFAHDAFVDNKVRMAKFFGSAIRSSVDKTRPLLNGDIFRELEDRLLPLLMGCYLWYMHRYGSRRQHLSVTQDSDCLWPLDAFNSLAPASSYNVSAAHRRMCEIGWAGVSELYLCYISVFLF
jgi:hypothetical protein